MLTPQEVAEHAFSKASFGGYNMAMVDEFLDLLTADYTTLYKENAVLKTKMKVLVDKVEEYRSTEDAMRKALLTAQKMADTMIAEAEQQRAELIEQAETQARARIAELRRETEEERARLASAQNATATYVEELRVLCQKQVEYLSSLGCIPTTPVEATPSVDHVARTAEEIGQAVEQIVTQDVPDVQVAPVQTVEPATAPTPAASPSAMPKYIVDEDTVDLGGHLPIEDSVVSGGLYAELMELNLNREQGERLQPTNTQAQEPSARPPAMSADESPTRRLDLNKLDNLQFGKEYEIK